MSILEIVMKRARLARPWIVGLVYSLGLAFIAGSADAQTCTTYPNTLTNGATADATQVMANFNCAALLGAGNFTAGLTVSGSSFFAFDGTGIGRFVSPNTGSTGGVIIRDATGNPNANFLQFVNNADTAQYGFVEGLQSGGLAFGGGKILLNTQSTFDGVSNAVAQINGGSGTPLALYTSSPPQTFVSFETNTTSRVGWIGTAGGLTSYNTTSDRRLKEKIAPTTRGLAALMSIPIDDFDVVTDPKKTRVQGFIAQDLYKVYPEAVTPGGGDANKNPWGVDYGRVTPLIVKAIQDMSSLVDAEHAALAKAQDALAKLAIDNANLRRQFEDYKKAHP